MTRYGPRIPGSSLPIDCDCFSVVHRATYSNISYQEAYNWSRGFGNYHQANWGGLSGLLFGDIQDQLQLPESFGPGGISIDTSTRSIFRTVLTYLSTCPFWVVHFWGNVMQIWHQFGHPLDKTSGFDYSASVGNQQLWDAKQWDSLCYYLLQLTGILMIHRV